MIGCWLFIIIILQLLINKAHLEGNLRQFCVSLFVLSIAACFYFHYWKTSTRLHRSTEVSSGSAQDTQDHGGKLCVTFFFFFTFSPRTLMNIKYTDSFQHSTDVCFAHHLGLFLWSDHNVKSYNGMVEVENNTVGLIYSCWAGRWCSLLLGLCGPECYPETRWLTLALLSSVISPLFILDVAPALPFVAGWLCVDILVPRSAGCCLPAVGLPGVISSPRMWG